MDRNVVFLDDFLENMHFLKNFFLLFNCTNWQIKKQESQCSSCCYYFFIPLYKIPFTTIYVYELYVTLKIKKNVFFF